MEYLKDSSAPNYVKHFYHDLGLAILDLEEYKRIFTEDDKRVALLNETASAFFNRLHHLNWVSFVMTVGRYLDRAEFKPGQENISFQTLVVKATGLPFEPKIKAIAGELESLGMAFIPVRHKLIAHADLRTILNEEGYRFDLQTSSVERIYTLIEQGLNLYFQHFDGHTHGWQKLPPTGGALSLIARLRRAA